MKSLETVAADEMLAGKLFRITGSEELEAHRTLILTVIRSVYCSVCV